MQRRARACRRCREGAGCSGGPAPVADAVKGLAAVQRRARARRRCRERPSACRGRSKERAQCHRACDGVAGTRGEGACRGEGVQGRVRRVVPGRCMTGRGYVQERSCWSTVGGV